MKSVGNNYLVSKNQKFSVKKFSKIFSVKKSKISAVPF